MIAVGNYQVQNHMGYRRLFDNITRISVAMGIGSVILALIYYIVPSMFLGRGVTAIAIILSMLASIIIRLFIFKYINDSRLRRRVLVFGAGDSAQYIKDQHDQSNNCGSYLVGFIAIPEEPHKVSTDNLIHYDRPLLQIVESHDCDEVVICMDDRRKGFPSQELIDCKLSGINIINPVDYLEREQGKLNLKYMNPSWMIFGNGYHRTSINDVIARLFDIIASVSILLLTLPVLLVTAFLIALESGFKHPIFYRQKRVGQHGEAFYLYKFRSMIVDAEVGGKAIWASQNDPRITRIGAFIRKTRIDELPQIFNILKGDMRLVGPRPERPQFVEELADKIPYYQRRHSIKPGLAGWAQLKYPYGASEDDAYQKLQYDLYYVKNNNVLMDFFILVQTAEIVIFGKGAR